jgi:5'-nucleotidase
VVAGDNFWRLSRHYYGEGRQWRRIAEANPDARPRRLRIGQTLTIPPKE